MSPVELRLRVRIDELSDRLERRDKHIKKLKGALGRAVLGAPRPRSFHCLYCGGKPRNWRRPLVCEGHSDLPGLDPVFARDYAMPRGEGGK